LKTPRRVANNRYRLGVILWDVSDDHSYGVARDNDSDLSFKHDISAPQSVNDLDVAAMRSMLCEKLSIKSYQNSLAGMKGARPAFPNSHEKLVQEPE